MVQALQWHRRVALLLLRNQVGAGCAVPLQLQQFQPSAAACTTGKEMPAGRSLMSPPLDIRCGMRSHRVSRCRRLKPLGHMAAPRRRDSLSGGRRCRCRRCRPPALRCRAARSRSPTCEVKRHAIGHMRQHDRTTTGCQDHNVSETRLERPDARPDESGLWWRRQT